MAIETDGKPEIEALAGALADALNRRDGAAAGALFAEQAVLLPPSRRMIQGRADIGTFWTNTGQRLLNVAITVTHAKLLGPAFARGIGRLVMKFDGPPQQEVVNKFLFVAEHSGAAWKIESLSWSRVNNAQGGRAQGGPDRKPDTSANNPGSYERISALYAN